MSRPAITPVVLVVAGFYAAFTMAGLALHDWNPLWFVWIGERFSELDPYGRRGYDGQFIYYLARDGWAALPHIDNPPYRVQRILYPVLARLLSAGNPAAIPWAMVIINAVAIIGTTFLVTRWLVAQGIWRWYGLVYPLFVGTVMAYSRDLTEPLSCALASAGVLCWFDARRALAVVLLALAGLARETTVLFALSLAIPELAARRWPRVALLSLATVPTIGWMLYVRSELGISSVYTARMLSLIPLRYLFHQLSWEPGRISAFLFIGLPMVALTPQIVRWLATSARDPLVWLVVIQWAFLLFAPKGAHQHIFAIGRQATALVVALVIAYPRCSPRLRVAIAAVALLPNLIWLPVLLWWAPWTAKF